MLAIMRIGRFSPWMLFAMGFIMTFFLTTIYNRQDYLLAIEEKSRLIQKLQNELACKTKGVLPSGGFCLDNDNVFTGCGNTWDSKLCEGIEDIVGHASLADMGCGRGFYGGCFLRLNSSVIGMKGEEASKKHNANFMRDMRHTARRNEPQVLLSWRGFEATHNVEEESGGLIQSVDLSKPLTLEKKVDWVMSIEVGEHIPKEGEQTFLDNVANNACKGVILSWALPNQGGYHHVNNRPQEYIAEEMKKRGLNHEEETQKRLRDMMYMAYLKKTVMVYKYPTPRC